MVSENQQNQPPSGRGGKLTQPEPHTAHRAPSPGSPIVYRRGKPPPPFVAYEDVVVACGHPEKFGLFEDGKDKYRQERRRKVIGRPCRTCREKKRLEEEESLKVRRAEKQRWAEEAGKHPSRIPQIGRLPDGAKFEVAYDAGKEQWTGTLTIGDAVFTGSGGALFTLLNRLDRHYRQSLPPEPPPS